MRSSEVNGSVRRALGLAVVVGVIGASNAAHAAVLIEEGFETGGGLPAGWTTYKNWTRGETTTGTTAPTSFQYTGVGGGHPFYGHNWPDNAGGFLAAPGNGASPSTIDLWLVSPALELNGDGAEISFWTFSMGGTTASLEVRFSAGSGVVPNNNGSYDNDLPAPLTGGVGDFDQLLLSINPTRSVGGYPTYYGTLSPIWTEYTATLPAGVATGTGYLAFRSGGVNVFSDPNAYKTIALDDVRIDSVPAPAAIQWALNADGNWSTAASWTGGVTPNGADTSVLLGSNGGVISGARTISNDSAHTVGSLTFDHAGGYTIAGSGALSVASGVSVVQGAHVISAPLTVLNDVTLNVAAGGSLAVSGSVSAAGKVITKTGAGSVSLPAFDASQLAVSGGSAALTGTGISRLNGVAVAPGATLDVGRVSVVVDYASGTSPRDAIRAAIAEARIQSAVATSNQAVGYIDTDDVSTSQYGTVDDTSVIVSLTLKGDTNLDHTVNFADLLTLAQHYGQASALHWSDGDSTYDGSVNFTDLLALAQNYGGSLLDGVYSIDQSVADGFAADWVLAQSLVPEPASLTVVAAGLSLISRRRRTSI